MERAISSAPVFRFGQFEADSVRNTLTRQGAPVKVQDQPFRVLVLLLERPGEIVTRGELRQKLWPDGTFVDFDGSLNVILKKLRSALDDDSDNPRFIETVPRRGYRFIAPVAVISQRTELGSPAHTVAEEDSTSPDEGANLAALAQRPRRRFPISIAFASAVFLLIGLAWYGRRHSLKVSSPPAQSTSQQSVSVRKSVAVLGFRNVSGKADDAWLATAFSEMLSTELATGEKLRLVSGEDIANLRLSSPWPQADTLGQETAERIGTGLNSDVLVLGSYTNFGKAAQSQLRLDVRLQDAKTGAILTEVAETGSNQDLFQVTSRIGARLRERLGVTGVAETDEAGVLASLPLDREASKFYALGLTRLREFDALAAKDLLEEAGKADPKFSLVHLMLARAWDQLGYQQKRKEEAKKALDLSVDLPRAEKMLVEGDFYESLADHEKAASSYHALFELFPDSVEYGLQLAGAQGASGHASQALETLNQLRRLPSPASDDPRIDIAEARLMPKKADSLVLDRRASGKASAQSKKLIYALARRDECMDLVYGEHPEQASAPCQDAYNIFLAAGNRPGAADAVRLMGDYQGSEGHYEQAIATYQRALTMLQELGELAKTGVVLNNMAINFANEGKVDRAEQLYRQAKSHFEQAGDKRNTSTALVNIADILYLRGNLPAAAKVYGQDLELEASLDPSEPGSTLYRLADLELAQGRVKDAHRLAQQAVDSLRPKKFDEDGAISELGAVLEAEGDLQGARRQYQEARDIRQTRGRTLQVSENQVSLAEVDLEENNPAQAEPLLRSALAEFEQEKADPDATSAYTVLSRTLLMQGKLDEARKAIKRAAELGRTSPDPALKLPIAIEDARIEIASAGRGSAATLLAGARQQLRYALATARRLGYYNLECDARLALSELQLKVNPALGRSLLTQLADDAHHRGLELIARKANAVGANVIAAAEPSGPAR